MKIQYKNYEIKVGEYSYDLYHLRPPKQVHKNKRVGNVVRKSLGYFNKLEYCVQTIIQMELSECEKNVSLGKFLEVYRSLSEEVMKALKSKL